MRELPPGLATDLAVLELSGSVLDDRGDYVVVRTPANPDFHWGNCLYVTDPAAVSDAERWVETFHSAVPDADWIAVALPRLPADVSGWSAHGVEVTADEVLLAAAPPAQAPLPAGYTAREITGADWGQCVARALRENERTGEHEPASHERFVRRLVEARRAMSDSGAAATFGAFAGGVLVAELGIVRCGTLARYQSVITEPAHQRRGLASHLLAVAARWAAERGCEQWVIVTEAANPAGRVYRRAGFRPGAAHAEAYRAPRRT